MHIYQRGTAINLTKNSTAEEIVPIAMMVHVLCGLPVTMRMKGRRGVRIDSNKVMDYDYTGPVLEEVLEKGEVIRKIPDSGFYKGVPVMVVPLKENGETIASIGIVDVTYGVYSEAMTIGRRRPKP